MPAKVVPVDELRRSPTAALFQGREDIDASMFITAYPEREQGPDLHTHPYPELFYVEAGTARFTAGDDQIVVEAGHVVVVPAETVHGFKNAGDGELRVVSVHPSPTVKQTNL